MDFPRIAFLSIYNVSKGLSHSSFLYFFFTDDLMLEELFAVIDDKIKNYLKNDLFKILNQNFKCFRIFLLDKQSIDKRFINCDKYQKSSSVQEERQKHQVSVISVIGEFLSG